MALFRFMDLEIWQKSIELNDEIYDIAELIEYNKKFRMAEQLRAASLSISNNIAEGSGSHSGKDFANFLNISRRSLYEVVNILIITKNKSFITEETLNRLLSELSVLSKRITAFKKSVYKTE